MGLEKQTRELVAKSRMAQEQLESYTQEKVDALCKAMCLAFRENAELFSREVVSETGLGKYEHKLIKNFGAPDAMWLAVKGRKSVGIIDRNESRGIVTVARPVGVVVVVAPTTNPNVTALCNAVFAVKGRNTCIVCAHPRAQNTSRHTVEVLNDAMKKCGAPDNIVQIVEEPSVEKTKALMRAADVIVATGGMGMVRSAYSSGKPAYGVGSGNVQALIDRGYSYLEAAQQIVMSRSFDNGLICAGEQAVIAPEDQIDDVIEAFEKNGAFYTADPAIMMRFRQYVFVDGKLNPEAIGMTAVQLAEAVGVNVPATTQAILLQGDSKNIGAQDYFCGEKLCPAMILLPYHGWEDALRIAKTNLLYYGAGHSAAVHTDDHAKARQALLSLPVGRVVCNQPAIAVGNAFLVNGLEPTSTLGCGSWGNNSISENLTFKHLLNITKLSYSISGAVPPTPEDLYGTDWSS